MAIKRRGRGLSEINMGPFADIAFLLIIFFMLNTTFMKDGNIKLNPAASSDLEKLEQVQLSVSLDAEGVLRLQGNELTPKTLETAVENMLAGRDDRDVKLRVDRDLPTQSYLPVIKALSRAGATLQVTGVQVDLGSSPPGGQ